MRFLALAVLLSATAATAQQGLRDSDILLSEAELTEYVSGQVLEYYTDGLATYQTDGGFDYRYEADGERIPGTYRVMPESTVCTDYANGFSRCDMIVQAGQRYVMIIENGERYPIRSRTAIE